MNLINMDLRKSLENLENEILNRFNKLIDLKTEYIFLETDDEIVNCIETYRYRFEHYDEIDFIVIKADINGILVYQPCSEYYKDEADYISINDLIYISDRINILESMEKQLPNNQIK